MPSFRDIRVIRGQNLRGPGCRGLWTQVGRYLDAHSSSFASKNKSNHHKHLTARNTIFGRIGRKFPEHFFKEGGRGEPSVAITAHDTRGRLRAKDRRSIVGGRH